MEHNMLEGMEDNTSKHPVEVKEWHLHQSSRPILIKKKVVGQSLAARHSTQIFINQQQSVKVMSIK